MYLKNQVYCLAFLVTFLTACSKNNIPIHRHKIPAQYNLFLLQMRIMASHGPRLGAAQMLAPIL